MVAINNNLALIIVAPYLILSIVSYFEVVNFP